MPKLAGSLVRYPARVTTTWFSLLILLGTALLASPLSWQDANQPISILDAAFTSTSAVCVTGLSVRSTGHDFSFFGQVVILGLIQLGGIGIMTVTTFLLSSMAGRSGLRQRAIVAETLGAGEKSDLNRILKHVFFTTMWIEGAGILLLWVRFLFEFPPLEALWFAVFHAISAFCNAGFGLKDNNLMDYQGDIVVNGTICCLIILGGIGFPVITELWLRFRSKSPLAWDNLHIHTKITLVGTAVMLVGGYVSFLILEWNGVLKNKSIIEMILIPMFHSVSCRTAGFNTIDLGTLSNASLFLSILWMFVGAGACSTAGGVKVSTAMMLVLHAYSRFQGKTIVSIFRRTIPQDSIDRAMASVMLFLAVAAFALTSLMVVEQSNVLSRIPLDDTVFESEESSEAGSSINTPRPSETHEEKEMFLRAMFEVSSALGTVGLSVNFTSTLSPIGRCIIILLMFLGRLGPVSVFAAVSRTGRESKIHYAHEEPLVG